MLRRQGMSKEIFEKNLSAMEKWYPSFAELLREREPKDDVDIMVETSWDGEKIFRLQKGDRRLFLGGKRNAKEPIQMWTKRIGELNQYAPVFLFGLGSGAYLKALIQNTNKKVNVIAYEPSDTLFLKMLEEIDLSKEIENRPIAFIVNGINETEFAAVMSKVLVLENIEFLKEEIHPNYKEIYLEEILPYIRLLHRCVEMVMMNYNTRKKLSTHIAQNVLKNIPYICEGYHVQELAKVIPKDRAAVLISAGPSLNKNIGELKKAKNRLFLVAVDTAIKPLLREGIVPDAFGTIDAKKPLDLIDVKGAADIPIIAPPAALNAMIKHQKGKRIFFSDEHLIPEKVYSLNDKMFPMLEMGGSVACMLFSLLYRMNFQTIILVGQDLAFTSNKSHADGTFQEKMPEENTKGMRMVKGNYEDRVPTPAYFKAFLDWFEDFINGGKTYRPGFRVINATEGGAYIKGTEVMTLREALEETCEGVEAVGFADKIEGMEPAFHKEEQTKAMEYLAKIPGNFDKIVKESENLRKIYQKIQKVGKSGGAEKGGCRKQLQKIKKITKKITAMPEYQLIEVSMPVADYILRNEYFYESKDFNSEIEEMGRKGKLYSEQLQKCAKLLKKEAEEDLLPWIYGEKEKSNEKSAD